jgi:RHS repeat-associated protein
VPVAVNGVPATRDGLRFYVPVDRSAATGAHVLELQIRAGASERFGTDTLESAGSIPRLLVPGIADARTYDQRGNIKTDSLRNYEWDALSRLKAVEIRDDIAGITDADRFRLEFEYDSDGRRIQKVVKKRVSGAWSTVKTIKFVWSGWNLMAELDGNDSSLLKSYVWGGGHIVGLLSIKDHVSNKVYWPAQDARGDVVSLVDASTQKVLETYEYSPYGALVDVDGEAAAPRAGFGLSSAYGNTILHSGKYFDHEVGLYYFGYRYYDPEAHRWLNRDPLGEAGGVNLYQYCSANPVDLIDPDGLEAEKFQGGTWEWYWAGMWALGGWDKSPAGKEPKQSIVSGPTRTDGLVEAFGKNSPEAIQLRKTQNLGAMEFANFKYQVAVGAINYVETLPQNAIPRPDDIYWGAKMAYIAKTDPDLAEETRNAYYTMAGMMMAMGGADVIDFVPDPSDVSQSLMRKEAKNIVEQYEKKAGKGIELKKDSYASFVNLSSSKDLAERGMMHFSTHDIKQEMRRSIWGKAVLDASERNQIDLVFHNSTHIKPGRYGDNSGNVGNIYLYNTQNGQRYETLGNVSIDPLRTKSSTAIHEGLHAMGVVGSKKAEILVRQLEMEHLGFPRSEKTRAQAIRDMGDRYNKLPESMGKSMKVGNETLEW